MQTQKLLFFGLPGAGKGTQSKLLKKFGFIHINAGDLIREGFKNKDKSLGPYKKILDGGGFVPDELIFELIEKSIPKKSNYILDGTIRTISRAEYVLEKNLVEKVIFFELEEKEAEKRILERNQNREDDNLQSIKKRFVQYKEKTLPIIEFLKNKGIEIIKIDASQTIKKIHSEVLKILIP